MQISSAIESVARSSLGRTVEQGLRTVGLFPSVQRLYNNILSNLVVRSGEYVVTIGNSEASFLVENRTEFMRIKSMTERNIIERVLSDLNKDDVFYDIGANVGVYSGLIGDTLPAGNVVAFEPQPKNVQRLKTNLSHNGISAHVFERALSNEEGTVSLSVAVESHTVSPGHNLVELNSEVEAYGDAGSERIAVDTIRGDDLISQERLPEPTVLKVDVEGAEFDVLAGLQQHLSSDNCRLVYCEVHQDHLPKFGASESELHNLLLNAGFTINKLADHGDKYHLRAEK